jgi:hypothetical protein
MRNWGLNKWKVLRSDEVSALVRTCIRARMKHSRSRAFHEPTMRPAAFWFAIVVLSAFLLMAFVAQLIVGLRFVAS